MRIYQDMTGKNKWAPHYHDDDDDDEDVDDNFGDSEMSPNVWGEIKVEKPSASLD